MRNFALMHMREWTEKDTIFLSEAMAGDELYTISDLQADQKTGSVALLRLVDGDNLEHFGSLVVRIDNSPNGNELVIVADGAEMPPACSAYKIGAKLLQPMAKALGCRFLRGHTRSPAIGRLMQRAGFKPVETVYRKEVH